MRGHLSTMLPFVALVVLVPMAACGGPDRHADGPKAVASVAPPADSADAGLTSLPELDPHVICEVYTRVGKKLGAELDARLDAGPVTEEDAKALMQRLSPAEAVPVVRAVMKEMQLRPEDVISYERAHPEIAQRCVSAMTHHLQPTLMRLARATSGIAWRVDLARAREEAVAQKKALLYVACASWERACRELDRTTFQDPRVKPKLGASVIPVYDDLADMEEPGGKTRRATLHIEGLPTVILFDRAGAEQKRWTSFVGPDVLAVEVARATK